MKHLLAQIDRGLKQVADQGEAALQQPPARELLKNLLYYVAKATPTQARVRELRDAFQLDRALPSETALQQQRQGLLTPSREVITGVVTALKEELAGAKDALDLFVRMEENDPQPLAPLLTNLRKIADTLVMIGLVGEREQVQGQMAALREMVEGTLPVTDASYNFV